MIVNKQIINGDKHTVRYDISNTLSFRNLNSGEAQTIRPYKPKLSIKNKTLIQAGIVDMYKHMFYYVDVNDTLTLTVMTDEGLEAHCIAKGYGEVTYSRPIIIGDITNTVVIKDSVVCLMTSVLGEDGFDNYHTAIDFLEQVDGGFLLDDSIFVLGRTRSGTELLVKYTMYPHEETYDMKILSLTAHKDKGLEHSMTVRNQRITILSYGETINWEESFNNNLDFLFSTDVRTRQDLKDNYWRPIDS